MTFREHRETLHIRTVSDLGKWEKNRSQNNLETDGQGHLFFQRYKLNRKISNVLMLLRAGTKSWHLAGVQVLSIISLLGDVEGDLSSGDLNPLVTLTKYLSYVQKSSGIQFLWILLPTHTVAINFNCVIEES